MTSKVSDSDHNPFCTKQCNKLIKVSVVLLATAKLRRVQENVRGMIHYSRELLSDALEFIGGVLHTTASDVLQCFW